MPRTYPPGVTCWVDTEQPDLEAATAFYGGLFGWTLTDVVPPGAGDPYVVATLQGQDVAALAPAIGDRPAAWNTYVAVDDTDRAAAAVESLGGRVVLPPADAGPGGRWALCADPFGAEFRLWQARRRLGAQLVNAPGSWNFSDLHTPDRDRALAFYGPLFGWVTTELPGGAGTMLQVPGYGDHLAATVDPGIYERQATAPPGFADVIGGLVVDEQPHWSLRFSVADRDDSAATAERLGATVLGSAENPWTRTALVRDPQGAEFTISQFTPPS
jgi:predicted enzyme related to lactoylglutathione lyase